MGLSKFYYCINGEINFCASCFKGFFNSGNDQVKNNAGIQILGFDKNVIGISNGI